MGGVYLGEEKNGGSTQSYDTFHNFGMMNIYNYDTFHNFDHDEHFCPF